MDRSPTTATVCRLVVAVVLVASLPVGVVGGVQASSDRQGQADGQVGPVTESAPPTVDDRSTPRIEVTASRSDDGDSIVYEIRGTDLPDAKSMWVLVDDAEVQHRTGLRSTTNPHRYRWDGDASTVRLTVSATGGDSADGSLSTAGDDWTFGPVPEVVVAWRPHDGSEIRRIDPFEARESAGVRVRSADGGFVGESFAVVGDATVHTRAVDSGTVRLAVPDTVEPRAEPAAVLDAIAGADEQFADAAGNETVDVFVLPRSVRDGGATFVSSDETWINAGSRLQTANNVWLHEYVHTRQSFDLGPRMTWFAEASAEYFGGRLARDAGLVSVASYRAYLSGRSPAAEALTNSDDWSDNSLPYHRGVSVLAALDSEIRERTDGERSLQDVFARMNRHDGVVTYQVFSRIVTDVAGDDVEPWLDDHVAGTTPVDGPVAPDDAESDNRLPWASAIVGVTLLGGIVLRNRPSL